MVAAQWFLNSFPFVTCLFIMFFGRMFSHVLRALMVFLVITCPMLGYIVLQGGSYSEGLLQEQEGSLAITAAYVVAIVWCMWANLCVVYTAIKRASIGKKIESIGIGFLITMVVNSYYMGHLHEKVIQQRPGVVAYMEWLILLSVVAISTVIHIFRQFPGMEDLMESFIHGMFGSFLTLQCFANMGLSVTEGLEWRRVLTHDFGCQTTGCVVTMSFFVFMALLGTVVQVYLFKAGKKDNPYAHMTTAIQDMLISLRNINEAIYSYSSDAESASDTQSLHALRMTFSEDVYKTIGAVSDVLLLTFALGLDAACFEMLVKDAYTTYGVDSLGFGLWLILFSIMSTAIAVFVIKLRVDVTAVATQEWQLQRHYLLMTVCMLWPIMVGSAFFVMTLGGEEIAAVDVPIINQRFGFHLLPIGCDSLNDPAEEVDETTTDAWRVSHAEEIMFANSTWWDGKQCHDGLLNGDEENVDCGGSCNQPCFDCQCHWSRVGTRQVQIGTGFPDEIVLEPRYPDPVFPTISATNGNETAYGDDSYCFSGQRNLATGNAVRYCFTTGGANCTTDDRPDLVDNTHEGFEWLDDRDTIRPCTRLEINEVDSGLFLPAIVPDCPPPPPPPPPPRRLWYCEAIQLGETTKCYDCDTTDVDWETPICGFETEVTCNDVANLKQELPTIVVLVWGVMITSMISALSGSGSLGGTYLIVAKLTTYLTGLNFVQGVFIAVVGKLLNSSTGDALKDLEATTGELEGAVTETANGMTIEEVKDLQNQLQGMSLWNMLISLGVFMALQSLVGLAGMRMASHKHGGLLLWIYLLMLMVTMVISCCLFGVAVFFALNIDEIADEYWDILIEPNLQMTNSSAIEEYDFSEVQKHEFVEFSRGSFRCLILIGCWIASMILALIIGTYYTLGTRNSDEAKRARQRKGAVSNPMWAAAAVAEDMNSPLTGGIKAGAEMAGGVGMAAVGMAGAMADMVVVSDSEEDHSSSDEEHKDPKDSFAKTVAKDAAKGATNGVAAVATGSAGAAVGAAGKVADGGAKVAKKGAKKTKHSKKHGPKHATDGTQLADHPSDSED